ncbi:beta-ketoacyl synthase chain length factor [Hydrogenophaga sp. RWCD_12]|uniref:beta-ketoacyl synthase chain length factor n=1 Tax=Hydrogenophaga sp. RWCD_12 TaxID=3391190 RepID=UPI003984BD89
MSTTSFRAHIEGISLWAPTLPGWPVASAVLRGERAAEPPHPMPVQHRLPMAERRRAPLTVTLSLAAAEEAVRASGRPAGALQAVFASAHGDLPVIEELCRTLVHTPTQVSPTRFLHSIHNAPAGVWSQFHRNHQANTAVSGAQHSFAQGLMEALVQCETEQRPVLFVAYDTAAPGALTHTTASRGSLAVALVVAPQPGPHSLTRLDWMLEPLTCAIPALSTGAARTLQDNAMAPALPLFEALAAQRPASLAWPLSPFQALRLSLAG